MDTSATIATWLSFAATAVGLGGLISQANAINDKMDPFHAYRNVEHLGIWFRRQKAFPWWVLAKPAPKGPVLEASLSAAFCQVNLLYVTRMPLASVGRPGKASWAVLLAICHAQRPVVHEAGSISSMDAAEKGQRVDIGDLPRPSLGTDPGDKAWDQLERMQLKTYQNSACVTISRTTLITFLCVMNARKVFLHSDAAGFRAAFASYSGQWHINWPLGQDAMVKFMPHDSHMTKTDAYPLSFVQRVDACVHMQCGIVYAQREGLKVAFCGRKHPGEYLLRYVAKGFPGAHGSRHLYNMMGGRVYEVDFISAAPASSADMPADVIRLELPSRSSDPGLKVHMAVPVECQDMIKLALDCLPWSCLSWSVHRGLRDILLASGKPTMGSFRNDLAALLKRTVVDNPGALDQLGWNPTFVRASMGDMTASAVMEGSGDSGDLVRVVTDIARVHLGHTKLDQRFDELDDVQFWRLPEKDRKLDAAGVVALTKFFVLEWSIETDYQLYHQLPLSVNFG